MPASVFAAKKISTTEGETPSGQAAGRRRYFKRCSIRTGMILANWREHEGNHSHRWPQAECPLAPHRGTAQCPGERTAPAFSRGELTSDGYCAIEGFRILDEAIRSGLRFRTVFFSESAAARAEKLLSQLGAQVETLLLPDKLFAGAVPSDAPQGVAALVRWKEFSLEDVVAKSKAGPLLAIAGVQDPGNLGTILRSAEAFGAGGVLLGEGTVSPFNPKVVRASAGSVFRLPMARAKLS